jgi:putative transposase
MKSFKYKVFTPNKQIAGKLNNCLRLCRELYNSALQERRDAYRLNQISLNYYDQANQLSDIKEIRDDLQDVHSQVLQDILKRLDKTFKAFYARAKKGQAGFPRFKGENQFDSFCFPQSGWKLEGDKLTLSKIGTLRLRLSREIKGKIKTVTVKKEIDGWYVIFACETEKELLKNTGESVGIDVGIKTFAKLSNGQEIPNPKFYRTSEAKLKRAQRKVSRKKKGSNRRRKTVKLLRKQHLKIKRQRLDFLHKESLKLVRKYDEIAVEDLRITNMVKNHHLAKSIADASWGNFLNILTAKAENAGREIWKVNAKNTSQDCFACGEKVPKSLSERTHHCSNCGIILDRDENAAKNILKRAGQTRKDVTYAVGQSVSLESPIHSR